MTRHRFKWELFSKGADTAEVTVDKGEYPFQALEPQYFTRRIKASDNMVPVPIPNVDFSYVIIQATYTENDPSVISPLGLTGGVKKGDPAPLVCRFNGVIYDFEFPMGFFMGTIDLSDLQIGTPYNTSKILVEIYLG
jgi:hypothetical protein